MITLDIPLFIRLLEFAREDAKGDLALHVVAENAEKLNKDLTMKDYWSIVKGANTIKEDKRPICSVTEDQQKKIDTILRRNYTRSGLVDF